MRKIYRYALKMQEGVREGLLLEVHSERGVGVGEIAPLPGFSRENLEEALQQLKSGTSATSSFPSVAFGMEMAHLGAHTSLSSFPIAPLLLGSASEIVKQAEKLQGVRCIKIKLGSFSPTDARALVKELKNTFRLRIDLNRKWSLEKSLNFFSQFSDRDFEYVEEPCENPDDLSSFPFPLAVDETLRERPLEELLKILTLKALIFKPTLQGGLRTGKILADAARTRGIDLIFSSSYESGVGIAQIAHLCHQLQVPLLPLGVDTYKYLHEDVLLERLNIEKGVLHLSGSHFSLDKRKLSEI